MQFTSNEKMARALNETQVLPYLMKTHNAFFSKIEMNSADQNIATINQVPVIRFQSIFTCRVPSAQRIKPNRLLEKIDQLPKQLDLFCPSKKTDHTTTPVKFENLFHHATQCLPLKIPQQPYLHLITASISHGTTQPLDQSNHRTTADTSMSTVALVNLGGCHHG